MRNLRRYLPRMAAWAAAIGIGALGAYDHFYPGPGYVRTAAWMAIFSAAGYGAGIAAKNRVRQWMRGSDD